MSVGMVKGWAKVGWSLGGGRVSGKDDGGNLNKDDGGEVMRTAGSEEFMLKRWSELGTTRSCAFGDWRRGRVDPGTGAGTGAGTSPKWHQFAQESECKSSLKRILASSLLSGRATVDELGRCTRGLKSGSGPVRLDGYYDTPVVISVRLAWEIFGSLGLGRQLLGEVAPRGARHLQPQRTQRHLLPLGGAAGRMERAPRS